MNVLSVAAALDRSVCERQDLLDPHQSSALWGSADEPRTRKQTGCIMEAVDDRQWEVMRDGFQLVLRYESVT
jgi:hypothetical protein